MSYEECKRKCPGAFCLVFQSCDRPSRYNAAMLDVFGFVDAGLALFQVVLLVLYAVRFRRHQTAALHIKIFAVGFVALATRAVWYALSRYYYKGGAAIASENALNAVSLTCVYLQQSFYIQTWIRILLMLNHMKGQLATRVGFAVVDSTIVVVSAVVIILRCANSNDANQRFYDFVMKFIAALNIVMAAAFAATGSVLFKKLSVYYQFCSSTVVSFLAVSAIFICVTLMRFVALMWKSWTGDYLAQDLFGVLAYFVPDSATTATINAIQLGFVAKHWSQRGYQQVSDL